MDEIKGKDEHEACRNVNQQVVQHLAGALIALAHLITHPKTPRPEAFEAVNQVMHAIQKARDM